MAKNIQGVSALTKVTKSLPHFSFRMKYKLQTQNIDQTSASNSLLNWAELDNQLALADWVTIFISQSHIIQVPKTRVSELGTRHAMIGPGSDKNYWSNITKKNYCIVTKIICIVKKFWRWQRNMIFLQWNIYSVENLCATKNLRQLCLWRMNNKDLSKVESIPGW